MGEYHNMKIFRIYFPIIGIILGEFLIFYDMIYQGIGIHIISVMSIILMIILGNLSLETKNILQSLVVLPMLRIISLSIPRFFAKSQTQHLLIYGVILLPIYVVIKNQQIYKESITILSLLLYSPLSVGRIYIHNTPIIVLIISIATMIGQYIGIIPDRIIPYTKTPSEVIGEFATIFLIIIFSISFLISDTKYWNKYVSNTLNMCTNPLLLTFIMIVLFKIMLVL
jgi:hypothetical protein